MQRTDRETWQRLLLWDKGQTQSERLTADVLGVEGYDSIDPSHPLGGPDGQKDIVLSKDNHRWIAAAYFPNGQKHDSKIKDKFTADLEGLDRNKADAFVFVTNQEISLSLRAKLEDMLGDRPCEIYHLERLRVILDSFAGVRLRHRYLDIPVSEADNLAVFNEMSSLVNVTASLQLIPTPRREVQLNLPASGQMSIAELAEVARQQGQFELHRGYVLVRDLLPPLSNPEHPIEPIIDVGEFPLKFASCHRLTHEAAMLTLLLHRCLGLQYTERLGDTERNQIANVIERLWRCTIRLRPVLSACQAALLMVASNNIRGPCSHMAIDMCATHLFKEIVHAADQTGYTSTAEALRVAGAEDLPPYDPTQIKENWPALVHSLSNNSTIHEGFGLLSEAFNDISAEIVRAVRHDTGLPIVPTWMINRT